MASSQGMLMRLTRKGRVLKSHICRKVKVLNALAWEIRFGDEKYLLIIIFKYLTS